MTDERQAGLPDEADDMCPNCVTPWKCNGPHVPPLRESSQSEACPMCGRLPAQEERLDVERLGIAMAAAEHVDWPDRWTDDDFAWIARHIAAEYRALGVESKEKP